MYDYRRNQKKEQNDSIFNNIKNLSSIAIVGTAGYQYLKRTNQIIKTVESANRELLERERGNLEDLTPNITSERIKELIERSNKVDSKYFSPGRNINSDMDDIVPGIPKNHMEFEDDEVFDIKESDYEAYDDLGIEDEKRILHEFIDDNLLKEAEALSVETATFSKARTNLERKYPGFQAALMKPGIEIQMVKESSGYAKTFDILLRNKETKKITKVSLPNYTNGYIREGFREWIHIPGATLTADGANVIMPRFDRSFYSKFMPKLERLLHDSEKLTKDPVLLIKKYIEGALDTLFQSESQTVTGNSIDGLTGIKYTAVDMLDSTLMAPFNRLKRYDALEWNKAFEGKEILYLTGHINKKGGSGIIKRSGYKSSVSGVSEAASAKNAKMASAPILGMGFGFDFHKQSTFRQNAMKGWEVNKSRESWAIQLGAAPQELLDELSDKYTENYTGRASNVGFYFAQEKNIFDGAAVYIEQELENKPNWMDFTARKEERHTVQYILDPTKHGKNKYAETSKLYKSYLEKPNDPILVNENTTIGIDPLTNKPILAGVNGQITHMYQDGNELKITISSNKQLTKGDKILQTKEVIEHITDSSSIDGFYLNGDKDIAKHLSSVKGKQGMEFLLNGSTMKRWMNGGVGMGFIHKVLSDIMELKKAEFEKKDTPESKMEYKKEMKLFATNFIRDQLGLEAVSAINEIHIDDKMNIGIEYKKNISDNSDIFHRSLEIENLIKHAEQTKNWDPFIRHMNKVEEFINKQPQVSHIKYNVIKYAETIHNAVQPNPGYTSAFIMSGNRESAGRLIHANLKMLMATHGVSSIDLASTASLRWNSRGFIGGAKLPAEMRRNFTSMGMNGLVNYADYLMDYRMNYIIDKTKTRDMFVLSSKQYNKDSTIMIGDRKVSVNTTEFLLNNSEDFLGKMQTEIHIGNELKLFHNIQLAHNSLQNIQGLSTELQDKLLAGQLLDIDDLTAIGKHGIGGNSVSVVGKEFMKEITRVARNRNPFKKGLYAKLPFEINFSGNIKGDMVSLINFDTEDSFDIMANRSTELGGEVAGTSVKRSFTTVGGTQKEYIDFFQKVSKITQEFNDGKIGDREKERLKTELETAVDLLFNNSRKMTGSKGTGYINAEHNGKSPFSVRGEIKGAISLKPGEVGITSDRATALLSGNQTKSFGELEEKIKAITALKSDMEYLSQKDSIIDTLDKSDKHRDVRKTINRHKSIFKNIEENLPKGNKLTEKLESISNIMTEELDKISSETNEHKISIAKRRIRVNAISGLDSIMKELNNEYINSINIRATINAIDKGTHNIFMIGERFPIKGPGAMSFLKVKIYNPNGVNAKDYIEKGIQSIDLNSKLSDIQKTAAKERFMENTRRTHDYLYMNQMDTLGISGDNDKDFMSLTLTAFETIHDIENENMKMYNMDPKDIKAYMDSDLRAQLLNPEMSKEMTQDTIQGYLERLTVISDNGKFIPANAQSSTILNVIENAKYLKKEGKVETIELRSAVEDVVNKTYAHGSQKEKDIMIDSLMKKLKDKVKSTYIDERMGYLADNMKFISNLNYIDSRNDIEKEVKQHISIIEPYVGSMTDKELMIHEASSMNSKKLANDFIRAQQDRYVGRFKEMKFDTPTAYKIGANLNRLAEDQAMPDNEKLFINDLADKIQQTTISTKHGTPSFLDFYKRTLKQLENSKSGDNALYERLASGNLELDMPGFSKELKNYGFIKTLEDTIDFDTFQSYLEEKEKFGAALKTAHESASVNQELLIKGGNNRKSFLRAAYKAKIDSEMANYKINGIHNQIAAQDILNEEQYLYSPNQANRMILMTAEEKTNAAAARASITHDPSSKNDLYTKAAWERLGIRLKSNKDISGDSFLSDIEESIRTRVKGQPGSPDTTWIIENEHRNAQHAERLEYRSSTGQSNLKVAAAYYNKKLRMNMDTIARTEYSANKLHRSQTNQIRRAMFERPNKPTIFYGGSVVDAVTGGEHLTAINSPEGIRSANRGGKAKLAAIGVGFIVGAFIGQSINMLTGNSSVPGLERSSGVGGEYYEHAGLLGKDIMGRQMEMFLKEKPVKLASEWSHWNLDLKYQKGAENMKDSAIKRNDPRHTTSYKGVMVR